MQDLRTHHQKCFPRGPQGHLFTKVIRNAFTGGHLDLLEALPELMLESAVVKMGSMESMRTTPELQGPSGSFYFQDLF